MLPFRTWLLACSLIACSASPDTPAAPPSIPEKPLEGNFGPKVFSPKTAELQFDKANATWFLHLRNYDGTCGVSKDKPPADALLVTIGGVPPSAGTTTLHAGDGHGATLQTGIFEAGGPTPQTRVVENGALRLSSFTDQPGATVNGGIRVLTADSDVGGTFVATVCAPR